MNNADWIAEFDRKWDLSSWLTDHATVYAKPEYEDYDNEYKGYIVPEARPDFLLDFPDDRVVACFVEDGEDIESLSRAFSPNGRLSHFLDNPGDGFFEDENGIETHPNMAAIVTQFSPFGRLLAEECDITNSSVNSLLNAVNPNSDFITHLLTQQLQHNITNSQNSTPDFIEEYGVIVGKSKNSQTFKPPAALINSNEFNAPRWFDLTY